MRPWTFALGLEGRTNPRAAFVKNEERASGQADSLVSILWGGRIPQDYPSQVCEVAPRWPLCVGCLMAGSQFLRGRAQLLSNSELPR